MGSTKEFQKAGLCFIDYNKTFTFVDHEKQSIYFKKRVLLGLIFLPHNLNIDKKLPLEQNTEEQNSFSWVRASDKGVL